MTADLDLVRVQGFVDRWKAASGAERATKDLFCLELVEALGLERPVPGEGGWAGEYGFEIDSQRVGPGGKASLGKIDFLKPDAFLLEAKMGSNAGDTKVGTAKRGTASWNIAMEGGKGQAMGYASSLPKAVPFLIVADIGYCFDLYADFSLSRVYQAFPVPGRQRIYLADLATGGGAETLRAVFSDPLSLDPARRTIRVTTEVAGKLAALAEPLRKKGHPPELVARFLMRCVFTMFAEDVGLLPKRLFQDAIEQRWIPSPRSFPGGIESLWRAMNDGGDFGFVGKLLKFNGGLFREATSLPLDEKDLRLLLEAAKCDWAEVEPAIFGTLLERALDDEKRHKLGAHYTPRAYIERLVRPTIEEPLRADWDVVRTQAHLLLVESEATKKKGEKEKKLGEARKIVRAFLQKLASTRVLDPACGSGNFLYVTLDLFKRLEGEILAVLRTLGETQEMLGVSTVLVTPKQFLGIEINEWAKEIAELVLWIGYLQWHFRTNGSAAQVPEPVLQDFGNIERRDALLDYDRVENETDEAGRPKTRWDGRTMKKSPVTGEDVPDEKAVVVVERYVNPRKASWPEAEFIVGNPPFLGKLRLLQALGTGYVDALRRVYDGAVPDSADYVMYWWQRAAAMLAAGTLRQFGFVTTNSITQVFNRRIVQTALAGPPLAHLTFAVPDHPWVDVEQGAAVRIAMTACASGPGPGVRAAVLQEHDRSADGVIAVTLGDQRGIINADLSAGADVAAAKPLASNAALTSAGVMLGGRGFLVEDAALHTDTPGVVRQIVNGSDLLQLPRRARVIDFFGLTPDEARTVAPAAFQQILNRVKPERDSNRRATRRDRWWLFSETMPASRQLVAALGRYIATPETSKHRFFTFIPGSALVEHPVLVIGLGDGGSLAVLSSRVHTVWALATGGTLENRPRYNKTVCFDPFPFPAILEPLFARIRAAGERLDAHRKAQQAKHPDLTITGMYNVLEKLRSGEAFTEKDRAIHDKGLVSVLKSIHDELDAAVFEAYGWPADLTDEQILEKLVALNAERAEEERKGLVRWLRADFQNPASTKAAVQTSLAEEETEEDEAVAAGPKRPAFPKKLAERIAEVRDLVLRGGDVDADGVAAGFSGVKAEEVREVLEALAVMGVVVGFEETGGAMRWRAVRGAA